MCCISRGFVIVQRLERVNLVAMEQMIFFFYIFLGGTFNPLYSFRETGNGNREGE